VKNNKIILLFDGVCNLCNGFVQFVLKRNKKANVYFGALQSESGQRLLKEKGLSLDKFETLIVITNGKVLKQSHGVFFICQQLDFPWPLLGIFRIIPRFITDFIYDKIAKSRYAVFGQRDVCMMPTEDIKNRFI
jgi:predicted DCC family thiol-disulfide oxidoreductase YuxK